MTGELNLFGVLVPALLVWGVFSMLIVSLLHHFRFWPLRHPAPHAHLFDVAMTVILTALFAFL